MDADKAQEPDYILGHSVQELERLNAQARLYEPLTTQFFHAAGLKTGMRVLDVGCGAGDVSILVEQIIGPTGQVVGVDRASEAVETASRRALDLHLPNTQFLVGDASELAFEEPFDAIVGRLVLMFSRDPSAVLRKLTAQLRPGGVIAFQEIDFSGCRSAPVSPIWSQCVTWIIESQKRSGANPFMGLKLSATFQSAGLPLPALYLHAGIGAGPDHPIYALLSDIVRTVLPALERYGLATAAEVNIDTLTARLRDEVVATNGVLVGPSLIGAAARKPARATASEI